MRTFVETRKRLESRVSNNVLLSVKLRVSVRWIIKYVGREFGSIFCVPDQWCDSREFDFRFYPSEDSEYVDAFRLFYAAFSAAFLLCHH